MVFVDFLEDAHRFKIGSCLGIKLGLAQFSARDEAQIATLLSQFQVAVDVDGGGIVIELRIRLDEFVGQRHLFSQTTLKMAQLLFDVADSLLMGGIVFLDVGNGRIQLLQQDGGLLVVIKHDGTFHLYGEK